MKPETKICQNCKKDFTIEAEDFDFYEKMKVPAPRICPPCRSQRRMAVFNLRFLYNRVCDLCKEKMVSVYHPDSPYVVYCLNCFFSDKWDPMAYGIDFDFSKDFFTQFHDLMLKIPHLCVEQLNNNNKGCEYANYTYKSSNVYLSYNVAQCENIYYSMFANKRNKDCLDSLSFKANVLCYEVVDSDENYMCSFLTKSKQCINSSFLFNCFNCQDCFMSSNLRNQQYVFRNKQHTKEEYLDLVSKNNHLASYNNIQNLKEDYKQMMEKDIVRYATVINSPNCTGNMVYNSKNVKNSFFIWDCENVKNVTYSVNVFKDSQDILDAGRGERMYELVCNGRGCYDTAFSVSTGNTQDSFYGYFCNDLKHSFGCVNLDKKNFCILNKQYSDAEYHQLREKIVEHMRNLPYIDKKNNKYFFGDFFPIELSPFGYNETLAMEEFPLSSEEVEQFGYKWIQNSDRNYKPDILTIDLEDNIDDIDREIIGKTLECKNAEKSYLQCTKAFRILPYEFDFYKRMNLAIPHLCPNCRYYERKNRVLPLKLWHRTCMCDKTTHNHKGKCEVEFETSYSPERPEIVYCEKCYQQEVY